MKEKKKFGEKYRDIMISLEFPGTLTFIKISEKLILIGIKSHQKGSQTTSNEIKPRVKVS